MGPYAEHLWHIGAAAGDIKYGLPRGGNIPSFLQVRQVSPSALDRLQRHESESRFLDLGAKFLGTVAVAGEAARKEGRHNAGADCLIQQRREGGITLTNPESQYTVEQNGPAGDGGRGDDTVWTHDTRSFAQALHPGSWGDQVVERTKEEHYVDRRIRHIQFPRIPHLGLDQQSLIASI